MDAHSVIVKVGERYCYCSPQNNKRMKRRHPYRRPAAVVASLPFLALAACLMMPLSLVLAVKHERARGESSAFSQFTTLRSQILSQIGTTTMTYPGAAVGPGAPGAPGPEAKGPGAVGPGGAGPGEGPGAGKGPGPGSPPDLKGGLIDLIQKKSKISSKTAAKLTENKGGPGPDGKGGPGPGGVGPGGVGPGGVGPGGALPGGAGPGAGGDVGPGAGGAGPGPNNGGTNPLTPSGTRSPALLVPTLAPSPLIQASPAPIFVPESPSSPSFPSSPSSPAQNPASTPHSPIFSGLPSVSSGSPFGSPALPSTGGTPASSPAQSPSSPTISSPSPYVPTFPTPSSPLAPHVPSVISPSSTMSPALSPSNGTSLPTFVGSGTTVVTLAPTPTAAFQFVDCKAISAGNATTAANAVPFNVTLDLVINNTYTFATIAGELQTALQTRVAPLVAGCPASTRRFLVEATIVNVLFSTPQEDVSNFCTTTIGGALCHVSVTATNVYYIGTNTSDFKARLLAAIQASEPFNIPGLLNVSSLAASEGPSTSPGGGGGAAAIGGNNSSGSTNEYRLPLIISASALGLLLLLALLLFAKRKTRQVRHLELKATEDDDTLLREIGGAESFDMSSPASPSRNRLAHVVGDDESTVSGLAGFRRVDPASGTIIEDLNASERLEDARRRLTFPRSDSMGGYDTGIDVHYCQSATCEICESTKRSGLRFIPIGRPARLPRHATRPYHTDDTVQL